MTTTTAPTPTRRAHEVTGPAAQRTHRRAVIRWALATGRPVHRDALSALIGARAARAAGVLGGSVPGAPPAGTDVSEASLWTAPDVGVLLWVGVADWCTDHGAAMPRADEVTETLVSYLRFLSAHRLLARGSDPAPALRRAVAEYGGTTGRSARHPSMARRSPAPVLPLA